MSRYRYFAFIVVLFTFITNYASAANVCPGTSAPHSVSWSSSNATNCIVSVGGGPGCSMSSGALNGGPVGVDPGQTGCSATISCSGPGGSTNASASLPPDTVVNGPSCCGTGSQVSLTVWNGSTCVAPTTPCPGWSGSMSSGACTYSGSIGSSPVGTNTNIPISGPSGYTGNWPWSCQDVAGTGTWIPGGAVCTPPPYVCSGTAPSGGNYTSIPASSGDGVWMYAASGECTWICIAGTTKIGNTCVAPSGTISAVPTTCLMVEGASTCNTDLTWNTNNPIGTSAVTKPTNVTVFSGNSGTSQSASVAAAGTTFYLINNGVTLATTPVSARCVNGDYWNGSACAPCQNGGCTGTGGSVTDPIGGLICNNGASNPPFCDQCPVNIFWNGSACVACGTGGCIGVPGGSTTTPAGGLVCTNGSTNIPSCVPLPIVSLTLDGSTDVYLSNYPGVNATIAWDGAGGPTPDFCAIPSGNWSNPSALGSPFIGSGNTDPLPAGITNFSYSCSNSGGATLATARATVCASVTPVLHPGNTCLGAPVAGLSFVSGNYTSSATVRLSCTNSNYYILKNGAATVESGVISEASTLYVKNVTISSEGDYTLECGYTTSEPHTFKAFSANALKYRTKPPEPVVTIMANPASISKSSASVISWIVMFPNSAQVPPRVTPCTLAATPVCTGTCTQAQINASTTINTLLQTGVTDANDPAGSRLISSAVNTLVHPGTDDWRATGKKTINLEKSMDFKLNCGGVGPQSSSTVRVIVTSSNEG